jgi:hypothetical protein
MLGGKTSKAKFLEERTPIARENLKLTPLLKQGEYAARERPLLRERPRYRSSMKIDRHSLMPCFTYRTFLGWPLSILTE